MRDAQYLRAQAEFCLEVASQTNDLKTVESLQADAARDAPILPADLVLIDPGPCATVAQSQSEAGQTFVKDDCLGLACGKRDVRDGLLK